MDSTVGMVLAEKLSLEWSVLVDGLPRIAGGGAVGLAAVLVLAIVLTALFPTAELPADATSVRRTAGRASASMLGARLTPVPVIPNDAVFSPAEKAALMTLRRRVHCDLRRNGATCRVARGRLGAYSTR